MIAIPICCPDRVDLDMHLPGIGEFDGVGGQVRQYLQQPDLIRENEARGVGGDLVGQPQVLLIGPVDKQRIDLFYRVLQVYAGGIEHQLAGLYLG